MDAAEIIHEKLAARMGKENLPRRTMAVQPGDIGLDREAMVETFYSQCVSRQMDRLSRRLQARGEGFYTIGSSGHENNAAVAEEFRSRYRSFVVDEYQDVTPLQQRLLDAWLGGRDDLCVVGDAQQTIYSFTGATPDHLLRFRERFPGATEVRLVRDYRELPPVEGNEVRLAQVFLNLLINAAHAITAGQPDKNEIRVILRAESNHAVIEVKDTGCGMPREVLDRIFDPFFTTKPVGVGTGLGLSICHGIITGFGGEITASSEIGRGSTFRISLPAIRSKLKAG